MHALTTIQKRHAFDIFRLGPVRLIMMHFTVFQEDEIAPLAARYLQSAYPCLLPLL